MNRIWKIFSIGIIAAAAVLLGISPTSDGRAESWAAETIELCGNRVSDTVSCYALALEKATARYGQKYGFMLMHVLRDYDLKADQGCHFLAHGIGNGAYERDPSKWKEALRSISSECSNGAIHSILERVWIDEASAGISNVSAMERVCEEAQRGDCVHFIGHYALIMSRGDVDSSITTCGLLSKGGGRASCYSGIFMEHIAPIGTRFVDTKENRTELEVKMEALIGICQKLSGEQQTACWRVLPYGFIHITPTKKIFDICNAAPRDDLRERCREYIVFMRAIKYPATLPSLYKTTCANDPDENFAPRCLFTIAYTTVSYSPNRSIETVAFCSSLKTEERRPCLSGIQAAAVAADSRTRHSINKACQNAPAEFQSYCIAKNMYGIMGDKDTGVPGFMIFL